VTSY